MRKQFLILLLFIISCNKQADNNYRYLHREQVVICSEDTDNLLNEALYAFEDALMSKYSPESRLLNPAYGGFVYVGLEGTAEYERILNPHLIWIYESLKKKGIIVHSASKSDLNYNHPAVKCIISNIEDTELKTTITALVNTNSMNPELFNSRLRNFGRDAEKKRYEALYIALDSFYQRITPDVISKMPKQSE